MITTTICRPESDFLGSSLDRSKLSKIKKTASSQLPIKSKNQETLTDKVEIMDRWKEYGQGLFCLPDSETQPPPPPEPPPYPGVPPEPPPLLSEVEAAIKQLKYGKSPGMDCLPSDLLETSGEANLV